MYLPRHFEEQRLDVLHAHVREHPFGLLVTQGAGGLSADGIPFLLEPGGPSGLGMLRGHVARANPVWVETHGSEALVVFQGPQGYVSPAWYASKAIHGKVVPTWNYTMVQARGQLHVVHDRAWLRALVTRLTDRHEATRAEPWRVDDAPAAYIESMLDAIVGVEIALQSLVGKWKLSQNRSAADRAGVVAGLEGVADDTARTPSPAMAPLPLPGATSAAASTPANTGRPAPASPAQARELARAIAQAGPTP